MRTATIARFNFEYAMEDVAILLTSHDAATRRSRGRPARELEVFKRAGVILAVTAWEAYIEDTLTEQFNKRIAKALIPADMGSTFNTVAHAWLSGEPKPKPPDLAGWTGEGWKQMILDKFRDDISALNTPNSEKISSLFKRYLDMDVTEHWRWQRVSARTACQRLDTLIRLRGELVHRGREIFQPRATVYRNHVVSAKTLIEQLVERTDTALGIAPTEVEAI